MASVGLFKSGMAELPFITIDAHHLASIETGKVYTYLGLNVPWIVHTFELRSHQALFKHIRFFITHEPPYVYK